MQGTCQLASLAVRHTARPGAHASGQVNLTFNSLVLSSKDRSFCLETLAAAHLAKLIRCVFIDRYTFCLRLCVCYVPTKGIQEVVHSRT